MRTLLIGVALTLSGCASTPEVRDLAMKTKAIATRYSEETRLFIERQAQLQRSANARLDDERLDASLFAEDAERARTAWRIEGNDAAERFYAIGSGKTADTLSAAMSPAPAAVAATSLSSPNLSKAIKGLGEIAKPPSREQAAAELIAFVKAFRKETADLRKKAEEAAAAAEAEQAKADEKANKP